MEGPSWERIFRKFLPLEVYEEISHDMADIFSAAANQYPPAQAVFESMSLPQLQQFVNEHAIAARNFDPHGSAHEVQQFIARLYKLIETLLIAIIVFGILAGAGLWVTHSRGLLETAGTINQIFITVLLGGPALLAAPAGLVLLYVRLLSFNSFVVKVLNRALVIGPSKANTRDEDKLVGYGLWNSSLDGGAAIKLLSVFSILWILSALTPRRDPYGFVKLAVRENIDVFVQSSGIIDATKRVFRRIRTQEEDGHEQGQSTHSEMPVPDDS